MPRGRSAEDASLLDILIDGFEKNEVMYGFHTRDLPLPDEATAIRRFEVLAGEAMRWKGNPVRASEDSGRRVVAWDDLEIRQAGRGILVCVRPPGFYEWWHEAETWQDDPMGAVWDWLQEEHGRR